MIWRNPFTGTSKQTVTGSNPVAITTSANPADICGVIYFRRKLCSLILSEEINTALRSNAGFAFAKGRPSGSTQLILFVQAASPCPSFQRQIVAFFSRSYLQRGVPLLLRKYLGTTLHLQPKFEWGSGYPRRKFNHPYGLVPLWLYL